MLKLANKEPPIQTENLRSEGANTLGFISCLTTNLFNSIYNRSYIPSKMVLPPDNTILEDKSLIQSVSHFVIDY